jgi:glyoxylase-like metal-dependent hydrolase (beta-lactamase superfamily II)
MLLVAPNLYRLTGLLAGNVYLTIDSDGMTLIDTSIARSGPKILQQIAALGRPLSDLKRILITHAHPDHIGGLPAVQRATGAQVLASAIERPVVEGRKPIPRVPPENRTGLGRFISMPEVTMPGTPVDRELSDGEVLPEVLGGMQVVSTPGHAPGHLAFWHPALRIVFCGDVIFRLPNLGLPFSIVTYDMQENKRSIRRIVQLEPSIVCFGHGKPLRQDTTPALRRFAHKVGAG